MKLGGTFTWIFGGFDGTRQPLPVFFRPPASDTPFFRTSGVAEDVKYRPSAPDQIRRRPQP